MSQIIQHYQTSFEISGGKTSAEDKFENAQVMVGEWVKDIELERYKKFFRNSEMSFLIDGWFVRRAKYSSKHSRCSTEFYSGEHSHAWVCSYRYRDQDTPTVWWINEIGLHAFHDDNRVIVNVKISYETSTQMAVNGGEFRPDIVTPWFISGLAQLFEGAALKAQGYDITPWTQNDGVVFISTAVEAFKLAEFIENPHRKLAVVLLMGEFQTMKNEASYLNWRLFGKALVFVVRNKPEVTNALLRYQLKIGHCRFMLPRSFGYDFKRHPQYRVCIEAEELRIRDRVLRAWVSVHSIYERGAVWSIESVQLLLRFHLVHDLQDHIAKCKTPEEFEALSKELSEMDQLLKMSEDENQELKLDNMVKAEELEKKEQERKEAVYGLSLQVEGLSRKRKKETPELPPLPPFPTSFKTLKEWEPFFGNLVFAEGCWNPAFAYTQFKNFDHAFSMLRDLDQILWPLAFEREGVDIASEFESRSKYGYARGEGRITSRNPNLARQRMFVYDGRELDMWQHIKYSNKPGEQLRIHFNIDQETKKIVVGWIGEHMDNATTRNIH